MRDRTFVALLAAIAFVVPPAVLFSVEAFGYAANLFWVAVGFGTWVILFAIFLVKVKENWFGSKKTLGG